MITLDSYELLVLGRASRDESLTGGAFTHDWDLSAKAVDSLVGRGYLDSFHCLTPDGELLMSLLGKASESTASHPVNPTDDVIAAARELLVKYADGEWDTFGSLPVMVRLFDDLRSALARLDAQAQD